MKTFRVTSSFLHSGRLVFALLFAASNAVACSCVQIGNADPVAAVSGTDAVFRARAVTTAMVLTNDDGAILRKGEKETPSGFVQRLVAFRVEELFKGDIAPLTILITGSGAGDCGYNFEEGKEYLVFATLSSEKRLSKLARSAPVLTTSICTFTQATDAAAEVLIALRAKFPSRQPVWVSWPK
jgi:hypothetical protein